MKRIILLISLAISVSALPAQEIDKAKLDTLFDRIEAGNQGMGRISVFHDGKEIYARSYGYADISTGRIADADTKFRIASITKSFTSAVVMKLVEQGRLSLDDKLADYYPGLPNAGLITLRDLLSHRTGYGRRLDAISQNAPTVETMFDRLRNYKGELGEYGKYEYGNMNFTLLTYIVEKVAKKSFGELLDEMIISPLGLGNTMLWNMELKAVEAISHRRENGVWKPVRERDIRRPVGAGGLLSTAHDINVFINALAAGKIVTPESLQAMLPHGGYGLGMMPMNYKGVYGYGHNGVFGIYRSLLCYYPSLKISIGITSNAMVRTNRQIADDVLALIAEADDKK